MNKTLQHYLVRLDNWVDADLCRRAVEAVNTATWSPHAYSNTAGEVRSLSGERELDIAFSADAEISAEMMRKIAAATQFYQVAMRLPWLGIPQHHSPVRYNRYGAGQLMLEHCDHITTLFDGGDKGIPVLSCVISLNDDFEGGALVMWGDEIIPLATGTAIVFPSNFLFPHRVEPVTSGWRYSCVSWAW